jgi:hypothetical protein
MKKLDENIRVAKYSDFSSKKNLRESKDKIIANKTSTIRKEKQI